MTSAVLICSMLPVALKLGEGGEGRAPLGAVLVGGMATSTLLSLVYVPVAYTYFDSLGALIGRLFRRDPKLPSYRAPVQRVVDGRHPSPEQLYRQLVKVSAAQRDEDEPLEGARPNRSPHAEQIAAAIEAHAAADDGDGAGDGTEAARKGRRLNRLPGRRRE
jgi:hypothetical protein